MFCEWLKWGSKEVEKKRHGRHLENQTNLRNKKIDISRYQQVIFQGKKKNATPESVTANMKVKEKFCMWTLEL